MKKLCSIYKSPRKSEMYLYVDKNEGLQRIPELLLDKFGKPVLVTHMMLSEEKRLARADVKQVMAQIEEKGFYLQMPPQPEKYMTEINNQKV